MRHVRGIERTGWQGRGRPLALALLISVVTTVTATSVTAATGTATATADSVYGISTTLGYTNPRSQFGRCTVPQPVSGVCPAGASGQAALAGYAAGGSDGTQSSAFAALLANAGGSGHMRWARFPIPYDALEVANSTHQCVPSPANANGTGAGQAEFDALVAAVQTAAQDQLTPEIVITPGTGAGGVPAFPLPGYGNDTSTGDPYAGETQAGWDYSCGVSAIISAFAPGNSAGRPAVTDWEAFNEPNEPLANYNGGLVGACFGGSANPCGQPAGAGASLSLCGAVANAAGDYGPSAGGQLCGPIEASELWQLADRAALQVQQQTGVAEDVAALTTSFAYNAAWDGAYVDGILGSAAGYAGFPPTAGLPSTWAVHDYGDVNGCHPAPEIDSFVQLLNGAFPGAHLQLWITEAGLSLRGACGVGMGVAGAADGSPQLQAQGAQRFLNLAAAGSGNVTVTAVDWFEFQPDNQSTGWDSGLLSAAAGGPEASPDGLYSQPRQSYCVLLHASSSSCSSSLFDASDWSTKWAASAGTAGLSIQSVTSDSVALGWTPAAGVVPEVFENGAPTPLETAGAGAVGGYTITGLQPNSRVTFAVANVTGTVASPAATGAGVTLASTPVALVASSPATTTVRLSWREPPGGNAPDGYRILELQGDSYIPVPASNGGEPTATATLITGLRPGTGYRFEVEAINSAGTPSPAAGPISAATQLTYATAVEQLVNPQPGGAFQGLGVRVWTALPGF